MGKRILIAGGAGLIGSHLADELLRQGHHVRVLDALVPQVHGGITWRPPYLNEAVSVLEVARTLGQALGKRGVEPDVTQRHRVGDIRHCFADVSLAERALGYTPRFSNVVFRMSCIDGPHQFGTEDQGWVAHFFVSSLRGEPITIYGDGKQMRDILFVHDLVDALLAAERCIGVTAGRAFNVVSHWLVNRHGTRVGAPERARSLAFRGGRA